jgi:hypothetical protein
MSRLTKIKAGIDEWFAEQERLYPNAHKEIHKGCCKKCPSAMGTDPETEDIKTYPKELIAKKFAFVCAWRNSKLCKGFCDNMGIDQQYLDNLYKDDNT